MTHTLLSSSNLTSAAYDPVSSRLQVRTSAGKTYEYADVPPEIHAGLMAAPSPGTYLHANIKGKFNHTEVSP